MANRTETTDRIARINNELAVMEYSDAPTNWGRHRDLQTELAALETKARAEAERQADEAQFSLAF